MMPFAIMVLTVGICKVSANAVRASPAPFRTALCPTRITGLFALKIIAAALSILPKDAFSLLISGFFNGSAAGPGVTFIAATFVGRST